MRAGIVVNVTRADRRRLESIISDRSAPQKHVWRANIILATADGCGTAEIMRRSGKSKPAVWRWQARFMAEGVAGLTRDKTRWRGIPAGCSTSPQPQHPGSMPSKDSSPNSRASASSAECSDQSLTCNSPSIDSSPIQMQIPSPSHGPQTQSACSPLSNAGSKR